MTEPQKVAEWLRNQDFVSDNSHRSESMNESRRVSTGNYA